MTDQPFLPINGLRVVVCQYMAGMKRAVKSGDIIYVSPAMWKLMDGATEAELRHLLENLTVIDIGPPPTFDDLWAGLNEDFDRRFPPGRIFE